MSGEWMCVVGVWELCAVAADYARLRGVMRGYSGLCSLAWGYARFQRVMLACVELCAVAADYARLSLFTTNLKSFTSTFNKKIAADPQLGYDS